MKRIFLYFTLVLTALCLTSCRSQKNVTTTMSKEELGEARTRFEQVVGHNFKYDTFQAKLKYDLGGKSLSGKLNIEHGKRLCLTVTVMGIEVARIEATPDQVMVVDKVDKVYAKAALGEVAARIGLQEEAKLETLEALLLGRLYLPGTGEAGKGDFSKFAWYPMDNKELQADYLTDRYQLSYVLDMTDHLVATQVKVPARQSTFVWEYANPVALDGGEVPGRHTLSMSGSMAMTTSFTMSNPSVAKKNWNSFQPSDHYREVTFAELIEIIKKMKG